MFNIMVVEDNDNTRKLMEAVLLENGYKPILARDGLEALDILDKQHIDLIVLDIMMPNMNGYELTKELREAKFNLPILMVTAKESPSDKKQGFIFGTDDYMVKPVDEEEMILRIAALLRRSKIASEHKLVFGETQLNYDELTVKQKGKIELLPQKEFMLLFKLLSYPNKIFTRRQLMDEIWGMDSDTDGRTVDVHINRLREKFKDTEDFQIITVRGLGYKAVKAE
ncbi:response regulator transcription factor [Clostridium intestinale]|uniref:Heme response regulator HssR n=1 Tax=Clostridium intestinale URNW TaxID=1294142 RepID=U2NPM9_9CLOT|nr:response regulator transcription factor [Clostridium intestinale]ERK31118.1 heme response regulator HssR [Clostridium intestinale URNW]